MKYILLMLCACSCEVQIQKQDPRPLLVEGSVDLKIEPEKWILTYVGRTDDWSIRIHELTRGKHTIIIVEDAGSGGISTVYLPE